MHWMYCFGMTTCHWPAHYTKRSLLFWFSSLRGPCISWLKRWSSRSQAKGTWRSRGKCTQYSNRLKNLQPKTQSSLQVVSYSLKKKGIQVVSKLRKTLFKFWIVKTTNWGRKKGRKVKSQIFKGRIRSYFLRLCMHGPYNCILAAPARALGFFFILVADADPAPSASSLFFFSFYLRLLLFIFSSLNVVSTTRTHTSMNMNVKYIKKLKSYTN